MGPTGAAMVKGKMSGALSRNGKFQLNTNPHSHTHIHTRGSRYKIRDICLNSPSSVLSRTFPSTGEWIVYHSITVLSNLIPFYENANVLGRGKEFRMSLRARRKCERIIEYNIHICSNRSLK